MSNQNLTHISVVLDKSGSMLTTIKDTIGGFNGFLETQVNLPGEATMSLCQFNSSIESVYTFLPVREVKPRDKQNYVPNGSTALLDAIGYMIKSTGEDLNQRKEENKPGKVIFLILTDGEENASRTYTRSQIFDMITHQRNIYSWEFIFMGCNQDAIQNAKQLGIHEGNTLSYEGTSRGTTLAWETATVGMTSYRTSKGSTTREFFKKP